MADPPEEAQRRRRLPRWVVLWSVFTVVLVIAGVAVLGIVWAGGSSKTYSCVAMAPANGEDDADDYCDRSVRDRSRRVELTQAQRDALAGEQQRAEQALDRAGRCAAPVPPDLTGCAGRASRASSDRPGPEDVQAVQQALHEAGFTGAVVRLARPDDPAMQGSIFFAIPLGEACFVGYMSSLRGGGNRGLVGTLPDGRC